MKKIIYIFLAVGSLYLTSCNDLLEETPKSRIAVETFFLNAQDAEAAVYGIYAPMRTQEAYRTWYPAMLFNLDDYVFGRGSQVALSEYQGFDGTNIVRAERFWQNIYRSINLSNIAITEIPKVQMSEGKKNELIGEAKFLRAFNYYQLVRNFGGVPLRLEAFTDPEKLGGKRASVQEVYAQIEKDLIDAEGSLPDKGVVEGRPTKWSAKITLADMYLTIEQWSKSAAKAEEVINSAKFSLVPVSVSDDFNKIFGPEVANSPEELWALKFIRVDQLGWSFVVFPHPTLTPYSPGGNRAHFARPTFPLIRDWPNEDLRKDFNLYTSYINRQTGQLVSLPAGEPICFRKYRDGAAPSNHSAGNDYYFYRYADALLIYAEAITMGGSGPTALAAERLNMVRRRAYGNPISTPSSIDISSSLSKEDFREAVLVERAYEFMCEFKRWHDLKRVGTPYLKAKIKESLGKDVKDVHLLWPIPQNEIQNNPDITQADQNPGY